MLPLLSRNTTVNRKLAVPSQQKTSNLTPLPYSGKKKKKEKIGHVCIRRYNHFFSPQAAPQWNVLQILSQIASRERNVPANQITLWFSNDKPAGCLQSLREVGAQGATVREPMAKKVWGLVWGEQKKTTLHITAAELWNVSPLDEEWMRHLMSAREETLRLRTRRQALIVRPLRHLFLLITGTQTVEKCGDKTKKLWGPQNLKFTPPERRKLARRELRRHTRLCEASVRRRTHTHTHWPLFGVPANFPVDS